jgi:hypothetical protein
LALFKKKSQEEIDKRKPTYAAAEFWGGEKDKWENGKKVGKEKVDGWYKEMALKTIARATYNAVPIDPKKVNNSYVYVMENNEDSYINMHETEVEEEIEENANKEYIDVSTGEIKQVEDAASTEEDKIENEEQRKDPGYDRQPVQKPWFHLPWQRNLRRPCQQLGLWPPGR